MRKYLFSYGVLRCPRNMWECKWTIKSKFQPVTTVTGIWENACDSIQPGRGTRVRVQDVPRMKRKPAKWHNKKAEELALLYVEDPFDLKKCLWAKGGWGRANGELWEAIERRHGSTLRM